MRVRAVGVVALMALVLASCGGAVPEAAGPSEGIQVHGDWTIDIYNPDGSLDEHVEFSNALLEPSQLVWLLEGTSSSSGLWTIQFQPGCPTDPGLPSESCRISGIQAQSIDTGGNLRPEVLRLVGSTTVEVDAVISNVTTYRGSCTSSIAPDSCTPDLNAYPFTGTTLTSGIPVTGGQTVQVQVDISFTSG